MMQARPGIRESNFNRQKMTSADDDDALNCWVPMRRGGVPFLTWEGQRQGIRECGAEGKVLNRSL